MSTAAIDTVVCRLGCPQGPFCSQKWHFHCASWFRGFFCFVLSVCCVLGFFFSFFLLLGSLRALMIRQRQKLLPQSGPVCSAWSVSLWSSDPSNHWVLWQCDHQPFFSLDRPSGLTLGTRTDVALTSPPVHLRYMTLIWLESDLGGWCQMNLDSGWLKKFAP